MNEYIKLYRIDRNNLKIWYESLVWTQIYKNKTVFERAHISYKVYCRNAIDGGNVRSVVEKFFLDALQKNGNIKNDTILDVVSDDAEYFENKENPHIEIIVTEKNLQL